MTPPDFISDSARWIQVHGEQSLAAALLAAIVIAILVLAAVREGRHRWRVAAGVAPCPPFAVLLISAHQPGRTGPDAGLRPGLLVIGAIAAMLAMTIGRGVARRHLGRVLGLTAMMLGGLGTWLTFQWATSALEAPATTTAAPTAATAAMTSVVTVAIGALLGLSIDVVLRGATMGWPYQRHDQLDQTRASRGYPSQGRPGRGYPVRSYLSRSHLDDEWPDNVRQINRGRAA